MAANTKEKAQAPSSVSADKFKKWYPLIFLAPAMLIMALMVAYPFFYGVYLSFTNMSLATFLNPKIVGLRNYVAIFQDGTVLRTLVRTIVWTVANVTVHVTVGLFLAVLLNRKLPGKGLLRIFLIIPWAIPQYIAALTWRGMFNFSFGAVNLILGKMGFAPIAWLSDPTMTFAAAMITNFWLGVPFMMMISLGGLQSIDKEMYEAADIDGANGWQKFRNITLPLLKPVLAPAIVLGTVWTFNQLNVILIMAGGFGNEKTQILVTEVYRLAFNFYRYGYAAAYSVIIFAILLIFGLTFMRKTQGIEEAR